VRIAIIENFEKTQLGTVGRALDEAGAEVDWFRPWQDGILPSGLHDHDGLIVLGGTQSAVHDADHPYLPALAALMRRFGDADKAVLGICLGSQLLARAYGGENILDTAKEFGWTPLDVTPEGAADPLFQGLGPRFESFEWHVDTFSLPENAVRLVSGPAVANQCFRIGRAAYGMQFHFEASVEVVEGWLAMLPDVAERMAPGWLARYPEVAARHAAAADRAGLAIARAFLETVQPARAAVAAD
jgi:GMP synthase (glutamine-hydrolysing)